MACVLTKWVIWVIVVATVLAPARVFIMAANTIAERDAWIEAVRNNVLYLIELKGTLHVPSFLCYTSELSPIAIVNFVIAVH